MLPSLLKELIGGTRAYDVVVPVSYEDAELANAKPLVGHLTMLRTNHGIQVKNGTLDGAVVVECSRCLKGVNYAGDPSSWKKVSAHHRRGQGHFS